MRLSLYLHIPFCSHKCPYCDFNSKPVSTDLRKNYLKALQSELQMSSCKHYLINTLFLGGGTPSELSLDELDRLVTTLHRCFDLTSVREQTIECNPGSLTVDFLRRLRRYGFDRLSLGAQSFNDSHLKQLGRIHSADDIVRSVIRIREAGFENLNLDLMFGLPHQRLQDWKADLEAAVELGPEHLSIYQLTIEPGTEFFRLLAAGRLVECDPDAAAHMYEWALDFLDGLGYRQYEVSNFARPGRECRHHYAYWHNDPYLGFGVSAASYLDGIRWANTDNWLQYIEGIKVGSIPSTNVERLEPVEAMAEEIILRLRTREGFVPELVSAKYGSDCRQIYSGVFSTLAGAGLLEEEEGTVSLTRRGLMLASEVSLYFLDPEPGCFRGLRREAAIAPS